MYDELLILAADNPLAKDLANAIRSYTKHGIFGKYFEGQSNLNLDNELIVLELEELQAKGNLKFIALLILMLKITSEMYLADRKQKKICIIDEAWDLMASGDTAIFIEKGYRRARKYNGAFITVTQKIDDYSKNSTTQACYACAAWKIMLMQDSPTTIELDEYTTRLLKSLRSEKGVYSDLLITLGGMQSLSRFIVDEFTQFLYSSTADDISLIKIIKQHENSDTVTTLERLIHIRNIYIQRYNRPRTSATAELLKHVEQYSYASLLNNLGLNIGAVHDRNA